MTRTVQDIFDTAVGGVIAQGRPSVNADGQCMYRSPDGAKCAAGQLIPDDQYNPAWENKNINAPIFEAMNLRKAAGLPTDDSQSDQSRVAGRLQRAHDSAAFDTDSPEAFVKHFRNLARHVAQDFELNMDVLK